MVFIFLKKKIWGVLKGRVDVLLQKQDPISGDNNVRSNLADERWHKIVAGLCAVR